MLFEPRNRHLLVEVLSKEEKEPPTVLLPENYKPIKEQYMTVKIIKLSPDCSIDCWTGQTVIVEGSMINEIKHAGKVFHTVLENYVMGALE